MICDTLANSSRYFGTHPGLAAAFSWVVEKAPAAGEGTYEIAPEVNAGIRCYATAPASLKKWESHRRHIDLQIVLTGSEMVGWSPISELTSKIPYDEGKDAEFYHAPERPAATIHLSEGCFAIFFPEDGHQPGVQACDPITVRKLVVKLAV